MHSCRIVLCVDVSDVSEWLAHVKAVSRHDCCRPQLQVVRLQDKFTLPAALVYSPQRTLVLRCPQASTGCCAFNAVCTATVQSCIFRPFSVCSHRSDTNCTNNNNDQRRLFRPLILSYDRVKCVQHSSPKIIFIFCSSPSPQLFGCRLHSQHRCKIRSDDTGEVIV